MIFQLPSLALRLTGTQTRIILKDKDYRRDETKHPNWIEVYQTGRFTPQKNKKHKRVKQHYLPEMLVSKMKLDINNALLFDKALSKISEKDELGNRYSADTAGSYNKLSDEIKNIYFEEFIYQDENGKKLCGYKIKDNKKIKSEIASYLIATEYIPKAPKIDKDSNNYLKIYLFDYIKMSLYTQLHILRNLEYTENFILYIKMQHKQELANFGRRYNILNEIPREDRKFISNLFGIDMASALQVIIATLVKKINPNIQIPFTEYYVANKKEVRTIIANKLFNGNIESAKTEITAIYQGRTYNPRFQEWHKEIENLFIERNRIRETIFQTRTNNDKVTKYAIARTNNKIKTKINIDNAIEHFNKLSDKQKYKVMNSYMFYYWTYFEREIQNVIANKFKYPKTLHDAVYTQNKLEFDKIAINELENEIYSKTNFRITLE